MSGNARRYVLVALNLFLAVNAICGAVWVVPALPREWLANTPFSDYTIPALALAGIVGLGALLSAILLVVRPLAGALASGVVGTSMMIFELVETSVVGGDLWLHLIGFGTISKGLPGIDVTGIPAPLGIPLPLWQQPVFFLLGATILVLSFGLWLRSRSDGVLRSALLMRQAPQP